MLSRVVSICLAFVFAIFLSGANAEEQQDKTAKLEKAQPASAEDQQGKDIKLEIKQAIETLNKAIADKNDPMRNKMYFKFRLIEQDHPGVVAPILIENLKTIQDGVPEYTAFILGWINDKRAIPPMREMLRGQDSYKKAASRALGFMRATESMEDLISLLKDPSPRVRQDAAYSLGLLGDDRANAALKEAGKDSDELVRFFAGEALDRIDNFKKYGW
jgi:HEAT repeat protein